MNLSQMTTVRGTALWTLLLVFAVVLMPSVASAQLDTRHWVPPLWSPDSSSSAVGEHFVLVSTPEVSPVDFELTDGAGNTYSGTVAKGAPVSVRVGYLSGSFIADTTGEWSGNHTAHVRIGTGSLNTVNTDGLSLQADRPVYMTVRQRSTYQGDSLTAKGRKALGTDFRAVLGIDTQGTAAYRGRFISVMAATDDTTITFDEFSPGILMFGQPDADGDGTTDPITVTLQANESYIIGIHDPVYTGTASVDQLSGTRVHSDKPIAMAAGYWLGGPSATGGQDIGIDELVPVGLAGTDYIFVKGNGSSSNGNETLTVVATQDNTEVFLNGSDSRHAILYNAGDFTYVNNEYSVATVDGLSHGNLSLHSTKPVLVAQSMGGSDSYATPGVSFVPPVGVDAAYFVEDIPSVEQLGVSALGIIARAGATLNINGVPTTATPKTVPGAQDWVTYRLTGYTGIVSVDSNSAVAVSLVNEAGPRGASGYYSGFPYGTIDLDIDETLDGEDNCPDHPNPDQADSDFDGVGDACDECEEDRYKAIPGLCGCGTPDGDPDGDGATCTDNCRYTSNADQLDGDGDGVGDACQGNRDADGADDEDDECPDDPERAVSGACGCGVDEVDSDVDGTPNCLDECPIDALKTTAEICGCNKLETDSDADGIPDCIDFCGNGLVDEGESCDDANIGNDDDCTDLCQFTPSGATDLADVDEDGSVSIDVQDNDPTVQAVVTLLDSEPDNGTAVVESDGTVTYEPEENFHGSDGFTYVLDDGLATSDPVTVSITIAPVNDAPVAIADHQDLDEDVPLNVTLAASDIDEDVLTYQVVDAPAHGTLSGIAPDLTYTPDAEFHGDDSFTFVVDDDTTVSPLVTVSLTIVAVNDTPVANSGSVDTDEDVPVDVTLSGSDVDEEALTYAVVSGPAHGILSGAAPDLTYTPDPDYSGPDSFTFRSNDGLVDSEPATVSVAVAAVNDAPVASTLSTSTEEDGAASLVLVGTDPDGDDLAYEIVDAPEHGRLSGNAPNLTYTPDADFNGDDSFTFRVSDGALFSEPSTVSVSTSAENDAPVAVSDEQSLDEDGALDVTLAASDIDEDALTYAVVYAPTHGILSGTAPDLTYTPDADFNGDDSFTFRVSDGTLFSETAAITLSILAVNDAPIAVSDEQSLDEDGALDITLAASDIDEDALTYEVVDAPTYGILSGTAPDLTYTPDADFNGDDSFTFRVSDGTLFSETAAITLSIVAVNDAPVAMADSGAVSEGGQVSVLDDGASSLLDNDADVEGSDLTAELETPPAYGQLTLNPNGMFIYQHDGSESGDDAFTYVVSDGELSSAAVTVTLFVGPMNDAPSIAGVDDQALIDPEVRILALSITDSDDVLESLIVDIDSNNLAVLPLDNLVFEYDEAGSVLEVHSAGLAGQSIVTLTVTDSSGLQDSTTFQVDVTCAGDVDGDGLCDGSDDDSDGDGLSDDLEGEGDADNDGVPDRFDTDSDNDGLLDSRELELNTDPTDADTDSDGLSDGDEVFESLTDPLVADTDEDGLVDGDEVDVFGSDPLNADTDADGLFDGEEVDVYGTDVLDEDTDADGLLDGEEVYDIESDPLAADTDGDGIDDGAEVKLHGTDPLSADTDGDGVPDGQELAENTDPLTAPDDEPVLAEGYIGGGLGCSATGAPAHTLPLLLLGLAGVLVRRRRRTSRHAACHRRSDLC
jgi:uncharacterized protein (TIGR03382 family)